MSMPLMGAGKATDGLVGNPTYWINMRTTLAGPTGFPGDGPDSSYSTGAIYAERTVGPLTFGWVAANSNMSQYTDFATDEHQAGRAGLLALVDNSTFRVSGFGIGETWRLRMSHAGITATVTSGARIYAEYARTTLLHTVPSVSIPSSDFGDILGSVFGSPALWAAGQGYVDITMTTADLYFVKASANNAYINAIGFTKLS